MNTKSIQEQADRAGDGVPDPHICAVNPYSAGAIADDNAVRNDFDGLLNCCQCHKGRPEGCCKKKVRGRRGAPGEFKCRFGYPFQRCETAALEFDELRNGKVRAKLVTKRSDGSINSH